jgi:DNA modification methylase
MAYKILEGDCFGWLKECPPSSIHGVVTDHPFGLLEYSTGELTKLRKGRGASGESPQKSAAADGSYFLALPSFPQRNCLGFGNFFSNGASC